MGNQEAFCSGDSLSPTFLANFTGTLKKQNTVTMLRISFHGFGASTKISTISYFSVYSWESIRHEFMPFEYLIWILYNFFSDISIQSYIRKCGNQYKIFDAHRFQYFISNSVQKEKVSQFNTFSFLFHKPISQNVVLIQMCKNCAILSVESTRISVIFEKNLR